MRLEGIDISKWQGDVDWSKVPPNVRFCIAKASQAHWADPKFPQNWEGMKGAGIVRGAYHLIDLTRDIQEQVDYYLSQVPFETGDLPPCLDVETSKIEAVGNPELATARILEWLQTVEERIGGKPLLYISPRGVRKLEGHTDGLNAYPLWNLDYRPSVTEDDQPELPETFTEWTLWQWTMKGPGEDWGMGSAHLDMDLFNGDEAALQELAHSIPWGTKNMLTPEQVAKAAEFNAKQEFTQRQVFRIYDVVRVTNPWDMTHVCNQIANFQGLMGLTADGMVGAKTQAKITGLL